MLPIVGGGHARLQPVYVRDVADGMINSLRSRDAIGQDFYLAGPEVLTCALGSIIPKFGFQGGLGPHVRARWQLHMPTSVRAPLRQTLRVRVMCLQYAP